MVEIIRLTEAKESYVADIEKLLVQLRSNTNEHTASLAELQAVTSDPNVAFIVARDDERIIGMATLYIITKFSKKNGHVEDVVVDDAYRGQGLGEKLMRALIDVAHSENVKTLHLTSRPERAAGNKLYQKLGFEQKNTNAYSLKL